MDNWVSTREPLFTLLSAGHETHAVGSDYLHDCRRRPPPTRVVLQLTLAGAAFHRRAGRRTVLGPGMAFLDILPGDWSYGVAAESRGPYEQVFVAFNGDPAFAFAEQAIQRFGNVLEVGLDPRLIAPMKALARQFVRHEHIDRYRMSAAIYEIGMLLLGALSRRQSSTCPVTAGTLRLIEDRVADPLFNVAAMARALGCSRSHLTRRFQAATASTPLAYLLQYRLDLASRALRSGNDPVATVARRFGFSSSNYFCRVFRRRYRISPQQHRLSSRM